MKKIQLEQYVDFSESRKGDDLTVNCLNQIISMHGFSKLKRILKKDMIDAVSTIDLMIPFRSTLKENISSNAFLTLEKAIEDLSILQWQECSVKSMETLSSGKEKVTEDDSSAVSRNAENSKLIQKGKSKKANILKSAAAAEASSSLTVAEDDLVPKSASSAVSRNAENSKLNQKGKKAKKAGILEAAAASSSLTVGENAGKLKLKRKRRGTKAGTLATAPPSSCLSLGSC